QDEQPGKKQDQDNQVFIPMTIGLLSPQHRDSLLNIRNSAPGAILQGTLKNYCFCSKSRYEKNLPRHISGILSIYFFHNEEFGRKGNLARWPSVKL
ncbi:MAG: hypothetical protein KKD01_06070, partial [Proteobacteria bacterium]|nr:hypothetical protein [Pseudomonadota bacterium]